MSFWSGNKISNNQSVIVGFREAQIDVNAYNLRMGGDYYVTGNATEEGKFDTKLIDNEQFIIPAGHSAYLISEETLKIPNDVMAFISMRTGTKFKGLINVSGFHVDPGYEGQLIYAVYNAGPSDICIRKGEEIFKIWFADLDESAGENYIYTKGSKASISNELIESGINNKIYSLQSFAKELEEFKKELNKREYVLNNLSFIWTAIVMGVVGGIALVIAMGIFGFMVEIFGFVFEPIKEFIVKLVNSK